jgi:hypothetical protein
MICCKMIKANRGQEKEVLNWKICQPWFSSSVLGFFYSEIGATTKIGIVSFNNGIQLKQERFWVKSKAKKILSKRSLSPKKRISQKNVLQKIF